MPRELCSTDTPAASLNWAVIINKGRYTFLQKLSGWVAVGGGGTPCDGLYGEAPIPLSGFRYVKGTSIKIFRTDPPYDCISVIYWPLHKTLTRGFPFLHGDLFHNPERL